MCKISAICLTKILVLDYYNGKKSLASVAKILSVFETVIKE